jgi:tetratricopeptide (TPR) repeat protein
MYYSKRMFIIFFISVMLSGCMASRNTTGSTVGASDATRFETIEIPEVVTAQTRNIWEKKLFLLPGAHPERMALRDRIVASLVTDFDAKKESDIEGRLDLFEEALSLHDSSDFRVGMVALQMAPMAMWVVDVFEKRGDEVLVLSGMRFLMFVAPEDEGLKERYLMLVEWSQSVRNTIMDEIERIDSLVELYLGMVRLVPDKELVLKTADLLAQRHRMIGAAFKKSAARGSTRVNSAELMMWGRMLQVYPVNVIYVFFRIGEPAEARKYLEEFVIEDTVDVAYLELLDEIFQNADKAQNYLKLANYLGYIDAQAELKACIIARREDPSDPRYPLCVGRSFEKIDRPECAAVFYREAADIAGEEQWYASVSELMWRVLLELHHAEHVEATRRVIEIGTEMVRQALEKYPEDASELRVASAMLLYTMGEVEFDNGRIDTSRKYLTDSFEVMADVRPLIKLMDIHYLLGDFSQGSELAEQALALELGSDSPDGFWHAIILEKRGDLLRALGKLEEAKDNYVEALLLWDTSDISEDRAPEAAFRRGIIFDRLGDYKSSQDSFMLAIRLDPERQGIYAQLISFLVIQKRLNDAKEFYRLAYNQDQIDAMWKIYYSLWIEGLSRRVGEGSFPMAQGYLEHSQGDTWQDKLARFYAGTITNEALLGSITSHGQRVEYEFYSALITLSAGKKTEAKAKLEEVIRSNLLGFFEYRMARAILQDEFRGENAVK